MGALSDAAGPVDRHLDEMFDRLAGTGAQGRRLLAEAEDHLWTATAAGRERGLDAMAAEREAVERFGSPTAVVEPVAGVTTRLLRTALGAWTVGGIALVAAGIAGLAGWVVAYGFAGLLLATDGFGVMNPADACARPEVLNPATCTSPGSVISAGWVLAAVPTVEVAMLLLAVGAGMVGVVAVARRLSSGAGWLPSHRVVAGTVTVLAGMVAALLLPWSVFEAAFGPWRQLSGHIAVALTALATAVVGWRYHRAADRAGR